MFRTEIRVDLPSELPAPPRPVRSLVRWLLGRVKTPEEGFEELIACGLTVLERTLRALESVGFDDILSIVVDGKPVYVDVERKLKDFDEALEGVVRCGALRQGFGTLRLTASAVRAGSGDTGDPIHVLADVRIRSRVPTGDEEIVIAMYGRVETLDIRPDETPRAYAQRVRTWVRDPGALDAAKATFDALADGSCTRFEGLVDGARAHRGTTSIRIIVPGRRQVARLRHLTFGVSLRAPVYRALPSHERVGAYDDPFYRHLYSPYYDLLSWIVAGEVLGGCWPRPDVELVQPGGQEIATGDQVEALSPDALEVPRDAVRVDERGDLVVDASIPVASSLDPAEHGSPHSPGWAGEGWDDGGDGDDGAGEATCSGAG
jgi:hypothetical protein